MSTAAAGRRAFTLVEVLATLLVFVFGFVAIVALVITGMRKASRAQGTITGYPTAISVAYDPQPWLPAESASDWTYHALDMKLGGTATSQGFINGFYVVRTETSGANDVLGSADANVYLRTVAVTVDVYDSLGGEAVAAYNTRFVRQIGTPP